MTKDETTMLTQELAQVISQIRRLGWQLFPAQKIRRSEFWLLIALIHADPKGMKASELSTQIQVTPAAVTHMLNSLEREHYIERQADPTDRRVVLVRLTEQGREILKELRAVHFEQLTQLIGFLGERDAKELLRLLSATFQYLSEHPEEKSVSS